MVEFLHNKDLSQSSDLHMALKYPMLKQTEPWLGSSIGASSQCAKVVGLIPHQGTYKSQTMNA